VEVVDEGKLGSEFGRKTGRRATDMVAILQHGDMWLNAEQNVLVELVGK
jgi:hypothetical protein